MAKNLIRLRNTMKFKYNQSQSMLIEYNIQESSLNNCFIRSMNYLNAKYFKPLSTELTHPIQLPDPLSPIKKRSLTGSSSFRLTYLTIKITKNPLWYLMPSHPCDTNVMVVVFKSFCNVQSRLNYILRIYWCLSVNIFSHYGMLLNEIRHVS